MSKLITIAAGALAALAVMLSSGAGGSVALAAPPSDGVYDIVVVEDGNYQNYGDFSSDGPIPAEFDAMSAPFTFAFIAPGSLTASNLSDVDVVILAWEHGYSWLNDSIAAALTDFVNDGGTLIVHSVNIGNAADPLLAAFGADYGVVYNDVSGDQVTVIDAAHPLVTTPNVIDSAGLTNWGSSYHSAVLTSGDAYFWASSSPDGFVWGCAPFGAGSIVINGNDPEDHDGRPETFLVTENEVTVGESDLCSGEASSGGTTIPPAEPNHPRNNVAGGIAGIFTPSQVVAPAGSPPGTGTTAPATAPAITPPSTGDAGLVDGSSAVAYAAIALVAVVLAAGGLKLAARRA